MAFSISPAVDKWIYQHDAFTIIFKAFDDNGKQCRNNQVSIQYNITYDGSIPDLTQMKRVYSDASGLIALVITKPCVISLYGIHVHDVNDISKGEIVQEIAMNYKITFQPIILNVTASYIGPDIKVSDNFDKYNLYIQAEMSDGQTKTISPSECIVKNYQIQQEGVNIKTVTYKDPMLETIWDLEVKINGLAKLMSLETEYIGPRKILGDKIFKEEVRAYGTFLTSIESSERREIQPEDWYFIDIPVITLSNKGVFEIGCEHLKDHIIVLHDIVEHIRLNVWYEGAKIEVGKSYDPNDVIVYLVYPNGDRRRISWKYCEIDSYLITKEGLNWFTITYTVEFTQVTQKFAVEGIVYKDYIDLDFKVLYITDLNSEQEENQENLTDIFKSELTFENQLFIDWTQFLKVVNSFEKYGLYVVTVPKMSGLSNRYDMDWEVLCIDKTTLKANIKKIYNEEEEKDGEIIN